MPRILVISFSSCPAPDAGGVELQNVLKALGPRHDVDVLVVRAQEQPFIERIHRARVLRVPTPATSPAERVDAFRRAARRQLEGAEYDVVHLRGLAAADAVLDGMGPSTRL